MDEKMPADPQGDETPLPRIAFLLGDDMNAVLDRSTFAFEPMKELRSIDVIAATQAVSLRFDRQPGGFDLPLVGLVSLSMVNGIVAGARLSPHLGPLTEAEAIDVCRDAVERLQRAGWTAIPGVGVDVDALAIELADPVVPLETKIYVGKWVYGEDNARVELDRSVPSDPDSPSPTPQCLVRILLENGPIVRKATAAVSGGGRDVVWRRAPSAKGFGA